MYYDERDNIYLNENKEKNENNFIETNYKEKNNYDYKLNEWDTDVKLEIGNINVNNFRKKGNELFTSKEGLNKGTMFKGIYKPYKNYIYKVVVKGEKDELLLKIQELTFKMVDLNLYLDVNPNDKEMYNEFKNTSLELKKYREMYEKKYGPLSFYHTAYYDNYEWINNPWPWMNEGGNKNV